MTVIPKADVGGGGKCRRRKIRYVGEDDYEYR